RVDARDCAVAAGAGPPVPWAARRTSIGSRGQPTGRSAPARALTRGTAVVSFALVRGLFSHVLVALSALALGYASTPWLQRWEVAPPPERALPDPQPAEPGSCAPWIEE